MSVSQRIYEGPVGTPRGSEFYDDVLGKYADHYAKGIWDWETFDRMADMALRFEAEDHERLMAV